jgi:demethylmenaquinone methyltransferase/2-methoxy-6-polyprenyl-1,4-benzoquinol methylase
MFTDFGFKTVKETDKEKLVHDLFQNVSSKYDLMNDLMSGGLHRYWKDYFVKHLPIKSDSSLLDLASGTGDIALKIYEKFKAYTPHITLSDLTEEMLDLAKAKAIDKGFVKNLKYVCSRAETLPFDNESFDGVTISFGLRNTTNKNDVLKEVLRILKPNGWFYCLEFSKPICDVTSKIYDFYSFNVIPKMGKFVANDEDAYQYLVESIRQFPDQETLKTMMLEVGFSSVNYENLTNGVVAIHHGFK